MESREIVIERATPADAEELLAFLKQVGGESDNLSFGAEGLPFTPEAEAAYLAQMADSRDGILLVARDNTTIVGNASLSRLPRRMGHRGEFSVSVLKEYQSRGIGTHLTREILNFAKDNGFEIIDLQVRSDHKRAIRLYQRFGFQKIGTHPAFFKIGDEEISFDYMCLRMV